MAQNFKISVDDKELEKAFTNLEKDAKTFEGVMAKLGDKIDSAFDAKNFAEYQKSIDAQKSVVEAMSLEYDALIKKRDEWASKGSDKAFTNEEIKQQQAEYAKFEKQLKAIDKELQSETKELEKQQSSLKLIQGEYDKISSKSTTYLTQLKNIREEMATLVSSDGTIPKENVQRYDELKNKLGELGTAYRRVQEEQKLVTRAGSAMAMGITQGLQAIAGTFTLVQGISAMFTDDAEKIQEIQKKLQTAMAITMGIQQVSTALHATSNLRIGLVAKATTLWDTAQKALNTSLGIGAGLSKAFLTGGVMALVVGVGYLVTQYSKWSAEQKKIRDLANSYLETTAKEVIQVQTLVNALKSATKDTKEYADARKEVNKIAVQYGLEQVKESDNLDEITRKQKAYTSAVLETAKAKGLETATAKASEKFAKDWSNSLDDVYSQFQKRFGKDAPVVFAKFSQDLMESGGVITESMKEIYDSFIVRGTSSQWSMGLDTNKIQSNIEDAKKAFDEYSQALDFNNSLFKSNTAETEKYIGLLGIQQQKLEELKSKYGDVSQIRDESVLKQYNQEKKRIEEEIKRLSSLGVETIKPPKQSKEESDYSKVIKDQITQLNKEREELEKQGIEGKIKLLQYEAQKELDIISKVKEESIRLGKDADVKMLSERENVLTQYYEKLIQKENDATEEANTKKLESYKSYEEKRADLVEEYNKKTKLAEGLGLSPDTINRIQTELKQKLSELNFAELMDTSDLGYLFEDLNTKATSSIQLIIEELTRLRDANSSAWSVEELKVFNDQIAKGEALMSNRKPLTSITTGIDEYKVATANIKKFKQEIDSLDAKDIANSEKILKIAKEIAKEEDARTKALDKVNKGANQMGSNISAAAGGMGEVMGMLESFGVEFDESIGGALSGIGQMGDALANLDVKNPASIISSGMGMIAGLGNTVSSLFGDKGRMISQKTWDEFDSLISAIDVTISKQKELFATMSGTMAESAVDRAIELEKTRQASIRDMGMEYMYERKANKHSRGYKLRKELEGMRKDLEASGFDLDKWGDKVEWIFQMSAKDIAKFREENLKAWSKLDEQTRNWLLELEKSDEAIKELENSLKDLKTGNTFENFLDAAMEQIRDFKGDIKDLSKFTEEQLRNAMLNGFKQQFMREAMQPYYDELAKIFSDDIKDLDEDSFGNWSDRLAEALKKNNDLLNEKFDKVGLDLLEETEKAPKASQGYQVQMSQETGDEISGMVRGMQMTLLNQESEMIKQTDIFSNFGMQFGNMQQELQAISNATLQGVYYLQDIEKHTRVLPSFSDKLDKIEQNTR